MNSAGTTAATPGYMGLRLLGHNHSYSLSPFRVTASLFSLDSCAAPSIYTKPYSPNRSNPSWYLNEAYLFMFIYVNLFINLGTLNKTCWEKRKKGKIIVMFWEIVPILFDEPVNLCFLGLSVSWYSWLLRCLSRSSYMSENKCIVDWIYLLCLKIYRFCIRKLLSKSPLYHLVGN